MNSNEIESIIDYTFKDKTLLKLAFTHRSYNNFVNNEKLEFLGDSVLGFIVTNILFNSDSNEGELTRERARIVCEDNLNMCIEKLGVEKYLISKNLIVSKAVKCDLCEAIIGAMYLDSGLIECEKFIRRFVNFDIAEQIDYKTALQEFIQRGGKNTIVYKTYQKDGTLHNPVFETVLSIEDKIIATATGANKRLAEQAAANVALRELKANE